MQKKRIERVDDFVVYQKASKLFEEFMEEDLPLLSKHFAGRELTKNQIRNLDSICANMEEGYGRKAGKEFKHFLVLQEVPQVKVRVDTTDVRNFYQRVLLKNE